MGVRNFFGMLPENLNQSKLYGVELTVSAVELQSYSIQMPIFRSKGFEKTDYPNDFFDVAIEMCHLVHTRSMTVSMIATTFMIHDYFLAKTIDQLRQVAWLR